MQENIMLYQENKLLSKQEDVVSTFSKHLGSVTDSLNLFSRPEDLLISSANETINSIIKKSAFQ